jgi:hypothetical protein
MAFERICQRMGVGAGGIDLRFYQVDHVEDALIESLPHWQGSTFGAAGIYSEARIPEGPPPEDTSAPTTGRPTVAIKTSDHDDPARLVAVMAHELAHVLLLGGRKIQRDEDNMEPLTDLLTVCFGFGIFNANYAMVFQQWDDGRKHGWSTQRLGYLSEPMFGYALARFAQLRGEAKPAWRQHLRLNVRTYFDQSLKVLQHEERKRLGR